MGENRVYILRAGSVGSKIPPKLVIEVDTQIHEAPSLSEARRLHCEQGKALADAMLESIPGGTMDALLVELMKRKASLLSIPMEW